MRLLVTRPPPDGERTAGALRARGHHVLIAPMLRMEALPWELADQAYSGVIMTSANAARVIAGDPHLAKLKGLPTFTVGRHTAEAARAAGFKELHCAEGDRRDLALLLERRIDARAGPLLYLAGEDRAGDVEVKPLVTAVVYRMAKLQRLPVAVEAGLAQGQIDGVLHFSRRSAQAYLECAQRADVLSRALAPLQFCLSCQVAEPLASAQAAGIKIAARPDEPALIELVDNHQPKEPDDERA